MRGLQSRGAPRSFFHYCLYTMAVSSARHSIKAAQGVARRAFSWQASPAAAHAGAETGVRAQHTRVCTMRPHSTWHWLHHRYHPQDLLRRNGFHLDLNWSLAADGVTPAGDAWRNAPITNLVQYSSGKKVGKGALSCSMPTAYVPALATDEYPGFEVMDLEAYEDMAAAVKTDLYHRSRLWVEDAAVGSTRAAEQKVRVISDSPEAALLARNMLQRTPLYHAGTFPRHILVVVNSRWTGQPAIVTDIDPEAAGATKATIVAAGSVPFPQILRCIGHAASVLAAEGGYRHEFGGNRRAADAAAAGSLELFHQDQYWRAAASDAHPDLLTFVADAVKLGDASALVMGGTPEFTAAAYQGSSTAAGKAAAADAGAAASGKAKAAKPKAAKKTTAAAGGKGKGKRGLATDAGSGLSLLSAHHTVWTADGLARVWAGATLPADAVRVEDLPRGALVGAGLVAMPVEAPLLSAHPSTVVVVGGTSSGALSGDAAVEAVAAAQGLSGAGVEKLQARLAAHKSKVVAVASEQDVMRALRG